MLLLNSFGIHSDQLRLLEAVIILSLLVFILNVIFNYGGYAAFLICKKTESPAKQANDSSALERIRVKSCVALDQRRSIQRPEPDPSGAS